MTTDTDKMTESSRSRTSLSKKSHPEYSVPALDKGLDILEALAAAASPLPLSEIARAVGQTPSAVFRLLSRLESRQYVTRDPVLKQYSLSLKLLELSHTYPPIEHLTRVSGPFMRELADSSRESVHLSVLNHARLVVLMEASCIHNSEWRRERVLSTRRRLYANIFLNNESFQNIMDDCNTF